MAKVEGKNLSTSDIAAALRKKYAANGKSITASEATEIIKSVLDVILEEVAQNDVSGVVFKDYFSLKKYIRAGREGSVNGTPYSTEDKIHVKLSESKNLSALLN